MNIDELYPLFADEFPGAPDEMLRLAVVGALMQMCSGTTLWNEIQDPITLVNGINEYDVDAPMGAQIVNIMSVHLESGAELHPKTIGQLRDVLPNWRTAESSTPDYYNSPIDFGTITVYPKPANVSGDAIVIRAVYQMKLSATTVLSSIATGYQDSIIAGVRARMFAKANQRWTDVKMAAYWDDAFKAKCSDIALETRHSDRVTGSNIVHPRKFGG